MCGGAPCPRQRRTRSRVGGVGPPKYPSLAWGACLRAELVPPALGQGGGGEKGTRSRAPGVRARGPHLGRVQGRPHPRDHPFWKFHFGQSPRDLRKFCFLAQKFFEKKSEKWSKTVKMDQKVEFFRSPRDLPRLLCKPMGSHDHPLLAGLGGRIINVPFF